MKTKRQGGRRAWRQALSVLLTLALAVGLVLAVPAAGGAAYATPDLTDGCSLTLNFQPGADAEKELDAENTVVDLYLIAEAAAVPGYDVYEYRIDGNSPYHDVVKGYLEAAEDKSDWVYDDTDGLVFRYAPGLDAETAAAQQTELVQLLAGAIRQKELAPTDSTVIGGQAENLKAGLYVALVHGAGIDDYFTLEKAADGTGAADTLCTVAFSERHVFLFQPVMVSLPGRKGGSLDTTDDAGWEYDVKIGVKCVEKPRYAALEIVKQTDGYLAASGEDTTVVFHVTATDPKNGSTVFEKIVPITLSGTKQPEPVVLANMIPAGSTVVVWEEYGGAGYSLQSIGANWRPDEGSAAELSNGLQYSADLGGKRVTIEDIPAGNLHLTVPGEISAEEQILPDGTIETVTFVNTYNNTTPGGGSVVNSFAGEAGESGEGYLWVWIRKILEDGIWTTAAPVPVQ